MTATIDWTRWRESMRTPTPRAGDAHTHDREEACDAAHAMTEMERAHDDGEREYLTEDDL